MSEVSLVIYSLTIRKKRTRNNLKLSDVVSVDGLSFQQVLKNELMRLKRQTASFGDKRVRLNTSESGNSLIEDGENLFGILKYGFHGDKSEIEDDDGELLFEKERNHTDFIQMFFSAFLDENRYENFLIFSTYKKAGIKTVFTNFLLSRVSPQFEDYTFRILPYWPEQLVDSYRKGKVEYVTFKSRKPLKDAADIRFDSAEGGEFEVITTIKRVKPKKGEKRGLFDFRMTETLKIQDLTSDESVYSASVGVKHKGHTRGIRVGGYGGHAPAHDMKINPREDYDEKDNLKLTCYKREADRVSQLWDL